VGEAPSVERVATAAVPIFGDVFGAAMGPLRAASKDELSTGALGLD
jgi:hypothetical protein